LKFDHAFAVESASPIPSHVFNAPWPSFVRLRLLLASRAGQESHSGIHASDELAMHGTFTPAADGRLREPAISGRVDHRFWPDVRSLVCCRRGQRADEEISGFLDSEWLYSRQEILARPSAVPAAGGVYGWWFRRLPPLVDHGSCCKHDGLTLLYVGISPRRPPGNGRAPSRQSMRQRLETHYAGNAEGSTLRKTLGCLLADELGIQLRRVGSGRRRTFVAGEQVLSAWMAKNALVSWVVRERPWELEDRLIASVDLPLNLEGNSRNSSTRYSLVREPGAWRRQMLCRCCQILGQAGVN
jgi:hypothetical protein